MKILHISPTFNSPNCGIGRYSHYLYDALKKESPELSQIVLNGFQTIHESLLIEKPDICHVQLEYGFTSAQRLSLLDEYCQEYGVELFITFHSLACTPHNVAARNATKLAHPMILADYGSFMKIKCGIPIVFPDSTLKKLGSKGIDFLASKPYLFFGQAHPHKQLYNLLHEIEGTDKNLFCIVSKPVQGSTDYYDLCYQKSSRMNNVFWPFEYLTDEEVLAVSQKCRAALFPYTEYGAVGSSAAVNLLLNNMYLPIYTTFASHFSHIPECGPLNKCYSLEEMLFSFPKHDPKARVEWVEQNSFQEVAKEHLKLYGI